MEDSPWKFVHAVEISRGAAALIKQKYGIAPALSFVARGLAPPSGLVARASAASLGNGAANAADVNGMRSIRLRG